MLTPKSDLSWRTAIEKSVRETWSEEEARARLPANPLNPELFFWEFSDRAPSGAMIAVDTGMSTTFFARAVRVRRDMQVAISGTLATMGPAVPYACAAKFAYPDRPAVAFVGDGAMQMLGMNALITVARHWKRWSDPRLIVAVLNNRDLNMVSWELRGFGGSPKVPATQDIPDLDYARYGELLGFVGLTIDGSEDVMPIWDRALRADRPVVIDVRCDPNVIALPPHVTVGVPLIRHDPGSSAAGSCLS